MTPPSRPHARTLGLGFGLLATFLTAACDQGPENHGGASRLAVVLTADDGRELSLGSYDVESGELTFAPEVQDDMRELFGGAGYRAMVAHDGEDADVDLDEGVAVTTADLEDGDVLELRVARPDVGTSTFGRLELRAETEAVFRSWKEGNIGSTDDWQKISK